jgi:molecular chaperone DnaK (HSP70)
MNTVLFLIVTLSFSLIECGPILGIDFGSDTMKVALLQNSNLDILINDQSSRKTPTLVGFRNDERFFGKLADDIVRWVPDSVFGYMRDMLGSRSLDTDAVKNTIPHIRYAHKLFLNESVQNYPFLSVKQGDEEFYSVIELVAMLLEKVAQDSKKELGFFSKRCSSYCSYILHTEREIGYNDCSKISRI